MAPQGTPLSPKGNSTTIIGTGTATTGSSTGNWTTPGSSLAPPPDSRLLCAWLDTTSEKSTPREFNAALGRNVSCFHFGQGLPKGEGEVTPLELLDDTDTDAILYLSAFPKQGLGAVTGPDVSDLVRTCVGLNLRGRRVLLRLAPDMNAPWNSWGQLPVPFITLWRTVYTELQALRPQSNLTEMVWAPFEGSGYPFPHEAYSAVPGTQAFTLLDTNRDGLLNEKDHPYAPYYPGDAFVDWVGLSVHYKGATYPWTENTVPRPGLLQDLITGQTAANASNFYKEYSEAKRKPFLLAETGALHRQPVDPNLSSPVGALEIKQAWWRQSFTNATFFKLFPLIKGLTLYEFVIPETSGQQLLDYSVSQSSTPGVWEAFVSDFTAVQSWYTFSQPWDNITFIRDSSQNISSGMLSLPPWVVALTFGFPLLVVCGWGLLVLWKRRTERRQMDTNESESTPDMDFVQKSDEFVDDTATVLNVEGTLSPDTELHGSSPDSLAPHVLPRDLGSYPSSTLVDMETDSRHATL